MSQTNLNAVQVINDEIDVLQDKARKLASEAASLTERRSKMISNVFPLESLHNCTYIFFKQKWMGGSAHTGSIDTKSFRGGDGECYMIYRNVVKGSEVLKSASECQIDIPEQTINPDSDYIELVLYEYDIFEQESELEKSNFITDEKPISEFAYVEVKTQ